MPMESSKTPLLCVQDLSVAFGRKSPIEVVHNISFKIHAGEKLALVGESGSGKSVTALSILKLHDTTQVHYPSGQISFNGQNLLQLADEQVRQVRGREIAMIFQEPMTSLNPVYTVGEQLIEPLMVHQQLDRNTARTRMIELLDRTGIVDPHKRFDAFPHMLSGGQRQRAMIAMALACNPKLLIADEPTTALDVTIQAQILELLEELQKEFAMAVLMITHDLNMVRRFADRICVMQKGRLVEEAEVNDLFTNPQHVYTQQLLNSQPQRLVTPLKATTSLLTARNLHCVFPIKAGLFRRQMGEVRAVDDVTLTLHQGETLGIVGESGSGKTTLGMCLLRLQPCTGKIEFDGHDLQQLRMRAIRPLRRNFQIVFQDPFSSLSPRMTVEQIIREGLEIHFSQQSTEEHRQRILKVLAEVGLEEDMLWRYPHEFSGGQRQRIAIARVLVLEPKLIMLDEPTSALDVSVQKQILELLIQLQQRYQISYIFITHDLNVIRAMAHRMLVMKDGQVVEQGNAMELFAAPQHAYTQRLLQASLWR